MRITQILKLLLLTGFLSGCWVLPFPDTDDRAVDLTEVESLIGANEAVVIDKIGHPTYRITQSHVDYFVYEGRIDTTVAVFAFWIPIGVDSADKKTLDCLRLEFKDGVLQSYKIETRSLIYQPMLKDCRRLFWPADDIEQIKPLLGTSMAKVKNTFGEPRWVGEYQTNTYLVYKYHRGIVRTACVLLDFGSQDTLRRYEIKSCGLNCPEIEWDCRQLFWTLDQLEHWSTKIVSDPGSGPIEEELHFEEELH